MFFFFFFFFIISGWVTQYFLLLTIYVQYKNINIFQSQRHLVALGDYMGANCHALVGGTTVRNDVRILKDGQVQVVAGTPGRVNHMIKNDTLGNCDVIFDYMIAEF